MIQNINAQNYKKNPSHQKKTGGIDDFFSDFAQIDNKTGGIDDFSFDSARFVVLYQTH